MIEKLLEAHEYAISAGESHECARQFVIWMDRVASALAGVGMVDECKIWKEAQATVHFYDDDASFPAQSESMKAILLGILDNLERTESFANRDMGDTTFQISDITRRNLFDELVLMDRNGKQIHGRLDLVAFLKRLWPLDKMQSTYYGKNAADDIWQHMINNNDWEYDFLFGDYLKLMSGPDAQFLSFLEEVVHPIVRSPDEQEEFVAVINKHLSKDGFRLQPHERVSSYPSYRAIRLGSARVDQDVKNLIFAADGPKPEIVLDDSISNSIRVVKNGNYCLIYDLPIPQTGLKWVDLVSWWASRIGDNPPTSETGHTLYFRLEKSLDSEPEKLFFQTYYKRKDSELRDSLPALIPQVYLHYDPYTLRDLKGEKRLDRQRMDFLLLLSNHERIVIEIDGKQHYSDSDRPSPRKYAEMVAADRKLRLAGYEIYRFGGYELQGDNGKAVVDEFVDDLFKKHGIS